MRLLAHLVWALERPSRAVLLALALSAAAPTSAATITVDCQTGAAIGPALGKLKPGDVLLVQGTCRENVLIPSEINGVTVDGQGKATITALDARQPVVQVLGREIIIKGFTVTGGFFGIAVNRGGTALIDNNTIGGAGHSGIEVSQNSFGRIVNNTIRHNRQNGILVLGSASAHIGVVRTDDEVPRPNIIEDNEGDGVHVIRASTARVIGNTLSGNRGSGLAVRQTSHADVAGNVFNANGEHGIHVIGNSGINLADSAMRLFERPNTTTTPNGSFGIRCELGAYLDGTIGRLTGKSGVKDVSDTTCIDRSTLTTNTGAAQLMSTCAPDSPERRGEIGCTVFQSKPLPEDLTEPVFWHIDRFDSADRARAAVGSTSIAFDAAGVWWLMTIERDTTDHHGGQHVTHVGPLPLPRAARYAMTAQSAMFMPGMYSLPHHHPGVEAIYVLEGEACYETPTRAAKLQKGETLALPGGTPMRAVVTGTARRHVLAVIVHDAAQPATMRMEEGTGPKLVACK